MNQTSGIPELHKVLSELAKETSTPEYNLLRQDFGLHSLVLHESLRRRLDDFTRDGVTTTVVLVLHVVRANHPSRFRLAWACLLTCLSKQQKAQNRLS